MKVGLVGWRGMVGSVLMQRMREENDFEAIDPVFFSTSNAGGQAPDVGKESSTLQDANDVDSLATMDVVITCQGGDYTKSVYSKLREGGWEGPLDRCRIRFANGRRIRDHSRSSKSSL